MSNRVESSSAVIDLFPRIEQGNELANEAQSLKPFLKWAGGKGKLLAKLRTMIPKQYGKYCEPFLGGGALFFDLATAPAYLSDTNEELINCYQMVRKNPNKLIEVLAKYDVNEDVYYSVRSLDPAHLDPLERASRFIYLNKTCFNGLYRVNKKGVFNTPFGGYKRTNLVNPQNLLLASQLLKSAVVKCADYTHVLAVAKRGDFIYFDPPYLPVGKFSDFKRYTKNFFYKDDHVMLASLFEALDKKGCFVLLSNSFHPEIEEIYQSYRREVVTAPRSINCKGNGRGDVKELIISNYDPR